MLFQTCISLYDRTQMIVFVHTLCKCGSTFSKGALLFFLDTNVNTLGTICTFKVLIWTFQVQMWTCWRVNDSFCPKQHWTPLTFCCIELMTTLQYMFHRRKKVIKVWNDIRLSKWWQNFNIHINFPFKGSLKGLCFYNEKNLAIFEQLSVCRMWFSRGSIGRSFDRHWACQMDKCNMRC